jgi:hypothetical protein
MQLSLHAEFPWISWALQKANSMRPAHSVAVAGDGAMCAGEERQIEIFDGTGKLANTWRGENLLGE